MCTIQTIHEACGPKLNVVRSVGSITQIFCHIWTMNNAVLVQKTLCGPYQKEISQSWTKIGVICSFVAWIQDDSLSPDQIRFSWYKSYSHLQIKSTCKHHILLNTIVLITQKINYPWKLYTNSWKSRFCFGTHF